MSFLHVIGPALFPPEPFGVALRIERSPAGESCDAEWRQSVTIISPQVHYSFSVHRDAAPVRADISLLRNANRSRPSPASRKTSSGLQFFSRPICRLRHRHHREGGQRLSDGLSAPPPNKKAGSHRLTRFCPMIYGPRYFKDSTSPLRSALTMRPLCTPASVSTAPFWLVRTTPCAPRIAAAPAPAWP